MKKNTLFISLLRRYGKKSIILQGVYISYLIVMSIAMVIDYAIGNAVDAYVEAFFILITLVVYITYQRSHNFTLASYGVAILSTLSTYALLIADHYTVHVFYTIVPLGFFILFSFRESVWLTVIHEIMVTGLFIYGAHQYPQSHFLRAISSYLPIALASLMIIFFGIVYHLAIDTAYRALLRSDDQKTFLLKEVHHRVKNNLNIISSLLGLQQLDQTDPAIVSLLQDNRMRIQAISMVHEILYKHEDFEHIELRHYLHRIGHAVLDLHGCDAAFAITGDTLPLPTDMTLRLGIITNELIINSIKHALDDACDTITIRLSATDTDVIYQYDDNDKRVLDPDAFADNKGLGLRLITTMTEQMDGVITIDTSHGVHYTIRIPYEA